MAARTEEAKLVCMGGLEFLVDGFQFQRETVQHYVLTHFHADHTIGLSRHFSFGTIYCTEATAALIVEILGVSSKYVRSLPLGEPLEVVAVDSRAARLTLLDADHCPGSALVVFEEAGSDRLVLHTGDCRASDAMRERLLRWLGNRRVQELFLDTTYCNKRWCFPQQSVACQWLKELAAAELVREPRTLFIVGSYQIGKERAVQAVAEAANSPAFVEHRRWRVVQLSGWESASLPSGRPLWSIDKEECQVWISPLGSLGHDALKHFLDSTKGKFAAVVAFRPTGWAWSPKAMARGSAGCRVWAENDGQTRVYSVPYSEHSSYLELQALGEALRPKKLIPTVNSETREGKERMMSHFLNVIDLRADRERMDHYLFQQESSARGSEEDVQAFVDVLAMSAHQSESLMCWPCEKAATPCCQPQRPASGEPEFLQTRWTKGLLKAAHHSASSTACAPLEESSDDCEIQDIRFERRAQDAAESLQGNVPSLQRVVDLVDSSDDAEASSSSASADPPATAGSAVAAAGRADAADLRCIDIAQQQRLLRFFEASRRPQQLTAKKPQKLQSRQAKKGKGKGKGATAKDKAARAPLLRMLGAASEPCPSESKKRKAPAKRKQPARPRGSRATGKRQAPGREDQEPASSDKDPKASHERRPTRFIPRPNARVRERIDRAFNHRLYFLARKPIQPEMASAGVQLDILGSTGNVYSVKLRPEGNECSCLDFAKSSGACKHILFVMLRILKLPRDDHRVWQTSFTASELSAILEQLGDDSTATSVRADATVLRGYRQACGEAQQVVRKPLPADCPICYEEMSPEAAETGEVIFCRTCGHNTHADCQKRWAAASRSGDSCPLCRSPWALSQPPVGDTDASSSASQRTQPVNLAAYSSEHQNQSLMELYPETHRWITRRDSRE